MLISVGFAMLRVLQVTREAKSKLHWRRLQLEWEQHCYINALDVEVYVVNVPPEEMASGEGGELTTIALEREKIGLAYRENKLANITQIYANTAYWEPNIGSIDAVFIDGCHNREFVYNDIHKVLKYMKPGSFILWHDFNLELATKYDWIHSVCLGVEMLYRDGLLNGRIFNIRDSWVGIYRAE